MWSKQGKTPTYNFHITMRFGGTQVWNQPMHSVWTPLDWACVNFFLLFLSTVSMMNFLLKTLVNLAPYLATVRDGTVSLFDKTSGLIGCMIHTSCMITASACFRGLHYLTLAFLFLLSQSYSCGQQPCFWLVKSLLQSHFDWINIMEINIPFRFVHIPMFIG